MDCLTRRVFGLAPAPISFRVFGLTLGDIKRESAAARKSSKTAETARKCFVALLVMLFAHDASAEVSEKSNQHFVVKHKITSERSVTTVYERFLQVQRWWQASHTFSGSAENLYFDFEKQYCFCETMPGGGIVRHLEAIQVQPGKRVILSGGLGPLQDQPVIGKMIWQFEQIDIGVAKVTEISLEYRVSGQVIGGMGEWPGAVDFVLGEQLAGLLGLLAK